MVFAFSFVHIFMNSWVLNTMKISKIRKNNHKNMKIPLHRNVVWLLQNYLVLFSRKETNSENTKKYHETSWKLGLGEDTQIFKYTRLHFQKCSPAPIPENEHQTHWMLSAVKNQTTEEPNWELNCLCNLILLGRCGTPNPLERTRSYRCSSWTNKTQLKECLCNINNFDNRFICHRKQARK